MKTNKAKIIKKLKPQFLEPEKGEVDKIVSQKLRESIQRQKAYREAVLVRISKGTKLRLLKELLLKALTEKKEKVEWLGVMYPVELLKSEFNLEVFYYSQTVANENYIRRGLIKEGLKEEEVNQVAEGKFKKTEELLEEKYKK